MKLHITPKVTSNRINLAFSHPRGTSCRIRSSSSLLIRAAGSGNGRVNKKNPRTPAPSRSPEELAKDFARLKAEFGVVTDLEFKPSALANGNGLFTTSEVPKGAVLLSIPRDMTMYYDKEGDVNMPDGGEWPEMTKAFNDPEGMPWYFILAAGLVDCRKGHGTPLYREYARCLMPQPSSLSMPSVMPDNLRLQFQHRSLIDKARQQQDRLEDYFPTLMLERDEEGYPCDLEWAFSIIRSRAFELPSPTEPKEAEYYFTPFLDLANHSCPNANCDFRLSASGDRLELYSLRALPPGTECHISYTGRENYHNQRMQAQYGFVVQGGNSFDKVEYEFAAEGQEEEVGAEDRICAVRLQHMIGDRAWLAIATGAAPYLAAAVRSLPLRDSGTDEEAPLREGERGLVTKLLEQTRSLLSEMQSGPQGTTAAQDEALLGGPTGAVGGTGTTPPVGGDGGDEAHDPRVLSAVRYRLERKRLLGEAERVLGGYLRAYYPEGAQA